MTGGIGGGWGVCWIEFTLTHFNALVVSHRDSFSSSLQNKCTCSEWLNSTAPHLSEHLSVHTVGKKNASGSEREHQSLVECSGRSNKEDFLNVTLEEL